jgi:hypothetical protein
MLFGCIAASAKVNVVLTADGTDKGTEEVCILETESAGRCNQDVRKAGGIFVVRALLRLS